ncbi:hypothetical protein BMYO_0007 [Bifidobacterium myosotis]|uniref:Uncharacterized protein n=1 Tax=Bifidobacterium myosotis TaxID=1630166 RepID=A0A261FRS3_9BIFI|nr:hypothetical protein [Bifidobacterium myosotis]OZG61857.1 hypothetical protein BMYO_0007 [Bifidobacterium myosotis]
MIPAVLFTKDLPGPLSMNRLAAFGTVHKLDESASYWSEHAGTLYGRATIVSTVAPFGTVACMQTAAWVWLGDAPFPASIDVISTSHFRSTSAGRRIRVFRRLTLPEQIIKLGSLPITTPTRTACDLVMTPEDDVTPSRINDLVCQLMSAYRFRPNDCLDIIKEHRHHKYAGRARLFFESIQREMNEVDPQPATQQATQPATQTSAQTPVLQTPVPPERPSLTTALETTAPKPTTSEPTTSGEPR